MNWYILLVMLEATQNGSVQTLSVYWYSGGKDDVFKNVANTISMSMNTLNMIDFKLLLSHPWNAEFKRATWLHSGKLIHGMVPIQHNVGRWTVSKVHDTLVCKWTAQQSPCFSMHLSKENTKTCFHPQNNDITWG